MLGTDDFFTSLENTKPFLKVALEGFAGSGKTRTMAEIAIGLHQRIGSKKPIAVFDTEKAAMFLRRLFADNGIDPTRMVLYKESRSLADLKEVMKRGQAGLFDVLMIDSITHVWEDFLASYSAQNKRSRLQFEDWAILKPKWKKEFSTPFVQDRYHALMCGRAGYEYSDEQNERTGKREIYKSGIKMKVEGETAYEPDVLVLMERFEEVMGPEKRVWRQATILKDRSGLIDGKTFENPSFKHFAPAVDFLLENPIVRDVRQTENTFEPGEDDKRGERRRRDILLEKIEAACVEAWPGQSADAKRSKIEALRASFGTPSWTEIEHMHPDKLESDIETLYGLAKIKSTTAQPHKPVPASLSEAFGVGDDGIKFDSTPKEQEAPVAQPSGAMAAPPTRGATDAGPGAVSGPNTPSRIAAREEPEEKRDPPDRSSAKGEKAPVGAGAAPPASAPTGVIENKPTVGDLVARLYGQGAVPTPAGAEPINGVLDELYDDGSEKVPKDLALELWSLALATHGKDVVDSAWAKATGKKNRVMVSGPAFRSFLMALPSRDVKSIPEVSKAVAELPAGSTPW